MQGAKCISKACQLFFNCHTQHANASLGVGRDAAKAMRDHGPHVAKTAVDDAVESFIQKMRHQGVGRPVKMSTEPELPIVKQA